MGIGHFCGLLNFKGNTFRLICLNGCYLKEQVMNVAKADYDKALADAIYVYDKALANAKVVYEQAIAEADYVYQCHFNVAKAGYQTDLDNAKVDYDRAVYVKGLALDTAASIKADDDDRTEAEYEKALEDALDFYEKALNDADYVCNQDLDYAVADYEKALDNAKAVYEQDWLDEITEATIVLEKAKVDAKARAEKLVPMDDIPEKVQAKADSQG